MKKRQTPNREAKQLYSDTMEWLTNAEERYREAREHAHIEMMDLCKQIGTTSDEIHRKGLKDQLDTSGKKVDSFDRQAEIVRYLIQLADTDNPFRL